MMTPSFLLRSSSSTTMAMAMSTRSMTSTTAARASVRAMDVLRSKLQAPSLLLGGGDNDNDRQQRESAFFDVTNPADPSSVIAQVPVMGQTETKRAIAHAESALPSWREGTTGMQRGNLLKAWSQAMADHASDIATIMTLESGKPLKESLGEVQYARSFLDYYAAEALRPTGAGGGFLVPTPFSNIGGDGDGSPKGHILAIQQGIGVVGCITPWNFPAAMITRSVGPALAAGCVSVVKPSEQTPLTALALESLAHEVGIPKHALQMVTADRAKTPEVGKELCTSPTVRQLHFTGSTGVGKWLYKESSSTMKKLSLELGGNAPFVVFADADLDQAIAAAMASKFRNAGQTCVCADRFLVHESLHDAFIEKWAKQVASLRVGNGMDKTTDMGPLITEEAAAAVETKVQEALEAGAVCVVGGTRQMEEALGGSNNSSHYYPPTILTNVPVDSRLWSTETFGPVAAVRSFATDQEALAIANDSPVGLAGYFCTRDLGRAFSFAKQLECGMVGVNEGVISTTVAPFGGVKESGLGREGSPLGLDEYLERKYIFMNA